MYRPKKPERALKIFYIVFAYIILFSLWWAYLLYAKNETAYHEKFELNEINYETLNPGKSYLESDDYSRIYAKYQRQRIMIIAEGSFFILLLVFGLMRVRRVFLKELELAGQQRNFMLSITHELKSPLSTIKLSLQTLVKRKPEPDKAELLVINSLADLERLESLVDNILFAAKIEREEHGFFNEPVNISSLIQQLTDRLRHNKNGIEIKTQIAPNVHIQTDLAGFTSLIVNLVDNAIKYSEPGSEVFVGLNDNGNDVSLIVADQGVGIPDDEKNKVFLKFYRVGNEDTRKTKGTGLGLYIVKRFVEIYGGEISVEDNQPRGCVFTIRLPK